jgi:ubiquinone/menaquinone biosynthesis C-methylase UbiE
MTCVDLEPARIAAEYERREKELSTDFHSWSVPGNLLMYGQSVRTCIAALKSCSMFPLKGLRIADIGCGFGVWLLEFIQWGADPARLAGVDLIPERVGQARRRIPQADLHLGNAQKLPWADESFDLVSQFTVFTSILDPLLRQAVAEEMLRVLRPGGAILWFDFRIDNPTNSNVRGIRAREIHALFAGCEMELWSTVLAPPISRRIAAWSWPLSELLYTLPLLRTHYTGLIRKRPTRK